MPRYGHAVLGGTFDHFHVGHRALLERAFAVGRAVSIGVTTEAFLAAHGKPYPDRLQPYATRLRGVRRWIQARHPARRSRVVPLGNAFGRSVEEGVDVLVVSADTRAGGRAVNAERRRLGRRPVPLEVVPVVLADDLEPVSSRRIRAGEIDRVGRRIGAIRVGLAVSERSDLPAARAAILRAFPAARLRVMSPPRTLRDRPPRDAAQALARRAIGAGELGVGVARGRDGGWWAAERSPSIVIAPRRIPLGPSRALESGLVALLHPRGSGRSGG